MGIEARSIWVRSRSVFGDVDAAACRSFVTRALGVPEIHGVVVDRATCTARLRCDTRIVDVGAVLRRLATSLQPDAEGPGPEPRAYRAQAGPYLRVFEYAGTRTSWELVRATRGRLLLRHDALAGWEAARRIALRVRAAIGITGARTLPWSRSLVVSFDPELCETNELLALLDEAVIEALAVPPRHAEALARKLPVSRLRRAFNLVLAAGSFGLAILGAILPGLPTVPFLLLTSYFLAGASPRLNARLERSRVFGPLLRDWRRYRGMSRTTKAWSLCAMALLVGATLVLARPPFFATLGILVLTSFGALQILLLPTAPEHRAGARLAGLPAPAGG